MNTKLTNQIFMLGLGVIISMQAWMLNQIVIMKEQIARLTALVNIVILAIVCLFVTGCKADGKFVPVSEWVQPASPGSTNYTVNPIVKETIGTAETVGGLLPSPGNQIVTGVAALIAGALGIVARVKSARASALANHLETREEQLLTERTKTEVLIRGVESAAKVISGEGAYSGTPGDVVKKKIREIATSRGVESELNKDVKLLT